MSAVASSDPGDLVWEIIGLKTMPVSTEWVSGVSPKLRGGLYIEAVLARQPRGPGRDPERRYPGWHERRHTPLGNDPAGQHPLRVCQPEAVQTQGAVLYVVRNNGIQPRRVSLAETRAKKTISQ